MTLTKRIALLFVLLALFALSTLTRPVAARIPECQATCETRAEQTVLACGRNGGSESDCYAAGFQVYCTCMAFSCKSPQSQCD
jgi:hypothetical protein